VPTIATTYSAAFNLIRQNSTGSTKLLEVNADGSIRTQNWKEKLGNFGARLARRYDLRKDTKDAAVAIALENLAHQALNGPNQAERNFVDQQFQNPAEFLVRYREARQRVEQRNAPRTAGSRTAADSQVRRDSVASLHQQTTANYGAVGQGAPAASAVTAHTGPDLHALAQKYQVDPRIAKFMVGGGSEFAQVIQALLKEGGKVDWADPIDKHYAQLLDRTYQQEQAVRVASGAAISDADIRGWAVACLRQAQTAANHGAVAQATPTPAKPPAAATPQAAATPHSAPAPQAASSAAAAPVAAHTGPDLQALAQKYGVNPRIAKFLVGGGSEFAQVVQTLMKDGVKVDWADPIDRRYAQLLDKTYTQEQPFKMARNQAISDADIRGWAVACLRQVQAHSNWN
jgi:predicted flap endonuclease-1-like 5' DNA nuclease